MEIDSHAPCCCAKICDWAAQGPCLFVWFCAFFHVRNASKVYAYQLETKDAADQ